MWQSFINFWEDFWENANRFSLFDIIDSEDAFRDLGMSRISDIFSIFGHSIILISLLNCALAIFPPQAQNPVWELKTIDLLIGQVYFFLGGTTLLLISYVIRYYLVIDTNIRAFELVWFKVTRWLILFISFVCLLMPPLIIFDTIRVDHLNAGTIEEATQTQLTRLALVERQLNQIDDINQLKSLLPSTLSLPANISLKDLKPQLQTVLKNQKMQITQKAEQSKIEKNANLAKGGFRNIVTALISFMSLLSFFLLTRNLTS